MTNDFRSYLLLAAALLGACATHTVTPPPPVPEVAPESTPEPAPQPGLYGVVIGRLVQFGDPRELAPATELTGVTAMTYDPATRRLYAVSNASGQPRLIAVSPTTGEATVIATIECPDLDLTLVEGLAVHPRNGTLYASGGDSTFASKILFTVDPATGEARQVARIRGTIQEEVDAMVFVDQAILAVDSAGGSSALYRLDPDVGRATRAGAPFPHTVTDLAFDPANRHLYAVQAGAGRLLEVSLDGRDVGVMPAPAGGLNALAVIPDYDASLFGDGFESGDASAWSKGTDQRR